MSSTHRSRPNLNRRRRVAAGLASGLVLLAGCGGGGGGGGSAQDILRQAFNGKKSINSGVLGVDLSMNLPAVKRLNGPVSVKVDGPFQSSGGKTLPKFEFTLGITASSQTFTAGATSTGDHLYVGFLGNNYVVGDQQFQSFKNGYVKAKAQSPNKSGLGPLGIDPVKWLTSPQKLGTTSEGGATTNHIQAGVDLPRLLEDLNTLLSKASSLGVNNVRSVPKGLTDAQKARIQSVVKSATVDVYAGTEDHILRRLSVNVTLNSGSIHFDLRLSKIGQDQTIKAPANAQPLSDLLSKFGGGLSSASGSSAGATSPPSGSGAGAGAAPASGSSGSGPSSNPAAGRQYLGCLEKAGQNIAAAQKCAALIGH